MLATLGGVLGLRLPGTGWGRLLGVEHPGGIKGSQPHLQSLNPT